MNDESKIADEAVEKLIDEIKKRYPDPITMAVVGRTGHGKSSTVNSLVGSPVAEVFHDPGGSTRKVREFQGDSSGFRFTVFDTPGFGGRETTIEGIIERLAQELKGKLQVLLYVVDLSANRFEATDMRAIRSLNAAFTAKLWSQTVFVFTHTDIVGAGFASKVVQWTSSVREFVEQVGGREAAATVGFVPISNKSERNPDGKEWMGALFTLVFQRIDSPLAFFASQLHRMKRDRSRRDRGEGATYDGTSDWRPRLNLDEDQRQQVFRQVMVEIGTTGIGVGIGSVFGPVGAVVGGLLGYGIGKILGLRV